MPYTYPIETEAMFEDRTGQFVAFGVPDADVERMRSTITDMWLDGPGGWVYEWSALGRRYAETGEHYLASLVYGCAKFPCLAHEPRAVALAKQVEEYVAAAPSFPVHFERRLLNVPYRGADVDVPVHIYSATGDYESLPVLLMCAGVDTWKMDIHGMILAAAQFTGATVVAFDMPGTGEIAHVPLNADADEVILGLVDAARKIGNGTVGYIAFSFGGNFAAMVGLRGVVDAAVNDGGPVKDSFTAEHLSQLPFGMFDIVGNAIGFDVKPSLDELTSAGAQLSRAALLEQPTNGPMFVINGADDYFVPQSDTLVFDGRPDTEVHLIEGTGHVCVSKLDTVLPMMLGWLRERLADNASRQQSPR
ncbi:MAG TPA: alpha/beta hydrolase [Acidimicrobiia bacterium]|jgi:esterase FrsA